MFYVNEHKGRHNPERGSSLCVKTLCPVSVTYFSTPLCWCQKHYLTFLYVKQTFLYVKHTVRQAEAQKSTLWILRMHYDE